MIIPGILASGISGHLGGNYTSLQTVTVGSGGASAINFSSIPSTYTHLQIRYIVKGSGSTGIGGAPWRFNSDSGTNYTWHYLVGDGSSAAAGGNGTGLTSGNWGETYVDGTVGGIYTVGIMDILDYASTNASTNKNKTIRHFFGEDMNGSGKVEFFSGSWLNSSTAVNAINFTINGGSTTITQYSQFALYGVK